MTARQVVHLVLEAGEDPKNVFRQFPRGPKLPGPTEVEYSLCAEGEDMDYRREGFDAETVEWIDNELDSGNEWAWCSAHVTASFTDEEGIVYEGNSYLGGCSYRSREDFMEPGGYYDDMKRDAYKDLVSQLEDAGYV